MKRINPLIRDCYTSWAAKPPIHIPWGGRTSTSTELSGKDILDVVTLLPTECSAGLYLLSALHASEPYNRVVRVEEEKSVPELYKLSAGFVSKHYPVLVQWANTFRQWAGANPIDSKEATVAWLKENPFYGVFPLYQTRVVPDAINPARISSTLLIDPSYRGIIVYNDVPLLALTWNFRE